MHTHTHTLEKGETIVTCFESEEDATHIVNSGKRPKLYTWIEKSDLRERRRKVALYFYPEAFVFFSYRFLFKKNKFLGPRFTRRFIYIFISSVEIE